MDRDKIMELWIYLPSTMEDKNLTFISPPHPIW